MNTEGDGTYEYDRRQYEHMLSSLNAYKEGRLPLGRLIAKLEALFEALRGADVDWQRQARSQWAKIEDCYGYALDEESGHLDAQGKSIVDAATAALTRLIESKICQE